MLLWNRKLNFWIRSGWKNRSSRIVLLCDSCFNCFSTKRKFTTFKNNSLLLALFGSLINWNYLMKNCRSFDGSCSSSNPSSGEGMLLNRLIPRMYPFVSTLSRLLRNEMRDGSIIIVKWIEDERNIEEIKFRSIAKWLTNKSKISRCSIIKIERLEEKTSEEWIWGTIEGYSIVVLTRIHCVWQIWIIKCWSDYARIRGNDALKVL